MLLQQQLLRDHILDQSFYPIQQYLLVLLRNLLYFDKQ
ncbi:hypothetical protein CoNPh11_CDS0113 [Staphylococcus phage S-CoN_Ph11]|nr:hypothetical protein CoNPh11_CDS0113 [Staphylococcus phage S-CoN_Ph11]